MRLYMKYLKKKNPVRYAKKIGVIVGENTSIVSSVIFDSEPYLIEIGNNSKISNNVRFVTHDGGMSVIRNMYNNNLEKFGKIRIGNNVFVGNNATIMGGVTIGDNVIVGYGSIVTHNIPDNEVWAGVPAKKICTLEEYYKKKSSQTC